MTMDATRLVLVRHGETDWNAATRIQGHTDIDLNARGRWQAAQVARALAAQGLDAVYSSDLRRAHDTGRAIAQACGLHCEVHVGLRERGFGCFEGLTFTDIEARFPEQALRWRRRDAEYGPEGGEVLQPFYERCVRTAREIGLRHPGQTVALVAHGGVLDCLYRAATGQALQAPRTWQIGNAAINRLLLTAESLTLVGWNDAAHLEGEPALDELR